MIACENCPVYIKHGKCKRLADIILEKKWWLRPLCIIPVTIGIIKKTGHNILKANYILQLIKTIKHISRKKHDNL